MAESLHLSQTAWALLDMLQQQLGVSVEVLDANLRPVVPAGLGEGASVIQEPGVAAETARALRTGDIRIDRGTGEPIGIFPLRVARQIGGVLIVARRRTRAGEVPEGHVEVAGHLARTAIEADLSWSSQLAEARHRTRRALGILRFLGQLGASEGERDLMNAVIQAATVWFDADCRVYQRQADASFQLAAALPGAEARAAAVRLDRARAEKLVTSRRFASAGDLDDLGLAGRRDEVLILPVGSPPDWLLIIAGALDQEVELTFTAIAKLLAAELQAREVARVERWARRLAAIPSGEADKRRPPERVLLSLLENLAADIGAIEARVALVTGGEERTLAALGPAAPAGERAEQVRPEALMATLADTIEVSPESIIRVTVVAPADSRAAAQQLTAWLKALQPWLREAVSSLGWQASLFDAAVEAPSFERRIQEEIERAKRFNLGLGLVLIGGVAEPMRYAAESLVSAIRSELRASDLMGRIRDGHVAVVLVHAEPVGAESVVGRLRRRLEELEDEVRLSSVQLGKAVLSPETPSADALIALALRQVQRVELRN